MTKHDDELRETRRRWRELTDSAKVYCQMAKLFADHPELLDYWQTTYDLAKAYYEQFASDDEAPADEQWMNALAESINAHPNVMLWYVRITSSPFWQLENVGPFGKIQIIPLHNEMTRGRVRRLLTALGIEVRQ